MWIGPLSQAILHISLFTYTCMCIHIHIYRFTNMSVHVQIHTCIYCVSVCIGACRGGGGHYYMQFLTQVYLHIHVCICMYIRMWMHKSEGTHQDTHVNICVYVYVWWLVGVEVATITGNSSNTFIYL